MCRKKKLTEEEKAAKKPGLLQEFKAFITRGNVIDLAVGVIIGGAFTAIVTALSDKILRPLINGAIYGLTKLCGAEGDPLASMYTVLVPVQALDESGNPIVDTAGKAVLDMAKSIYIDWGAFISAIINFLLIALVLFLIIKGINRLHEAGEKAKAIVKKPEETKEEKAE